jgi:BirA family biotin operon repressor/biotin-[acetyl-CoA-carboxylase] ligase
MQFVLGLKALDSGFRLESYQSVRSTSTEAALRGECGDGGNLWIVAAEQTAGHGRRGRPWQTVRGNLAASLLIVLPRTNPLAATLGFVAGLAVVEAIRACASLSSLLRGEAESARSAEPGEGPRLSLKWPNDVLIGGAKVAGILLESASDKSGRTNLVVGIGVNVVEAPHHVPYPATSLEAAGISAISAQRLFAALTDAWVDQFVIWDGGRGFAAIRTRWLEHAAGLGSPIDVRLGEEIVRGAFDTIDEQGMLVMRTPKGDVRKVAAGDVYFGAAATAGR